MRKLIRNIQNESWCHSKGFQTGNGVYNQDLSGQAILIEVGGVDNTEEELNRSIDVLAKAFGEYFWQAEKVNG